MYVWSNNPYGSVYDVRPGITGGYIPQASKSGVPSGVSLTNMGAGSASLTIPNGYSSFTEALAHPYDMIDFTAYVQIASSASGFLVFTRSLFRGPSAATGTAIGLLLNMSNVQILIADCHFKPQAPAPRLDAIYGKHYRSYRCHFENTEDGLGSHGDNELYGLFAEKTSWFYPNPEHADGSHTDQLMQIFTGNGHKARGCYATGKVDQIISRTSSTAHPIPVNANSDFMITNAGAPSGVDIQYNKLGGGQFQINVAGDYPSLGVIANNRMVRDNTYHTSSAMAMPNYGSAPVTIHADVHDNVWDDDGSPCHPYVAAGSSIVWP